MEQDNAIAFHWYLKSAKQNLARAQGRLGQCYEYGIGCQNDPEKAVKWYRRASIQGNITAQYHLALCLERGLGCERDLEDAIQWYQRAAACGEPNSSERLRKLLTNACLAEILDITISHAASCA